jgi:hypothetical protein
MEYASKGVAGTGLGLGIAGTALGVLDAIGGVSGLLGGNRNTDPGDKPITRYEMGLFQQINAKDIEISGLKSDRYTDAVANGLQQQINAQAIFNATQNATMGALQGQIAQLQGVTKLMIPNENLAPGYGRAAVMPISSLPPYFAPYPFPPVSGSATTTPEVASSSSSGTGN